MRNMARIITAIFFLLASCSLTLAQDTTSYLNRLQVITNQNAGRITEVTGLGVGMYGIPFWDADEQSFYFPSTAGTWQYSMSDLQHPIKVPEHKSLPPDAATIDWDNIRSKLFLTYSPDKRLAVYANAGETGSSIYLFIEDAKTNSLLHTLYADKPNPFRTYSGIVFTPQFYGDDLFYLSKRMLYRWKSTTGQEQMLLDKPDDLAISPSGKFLIDFTLAPTADSSISFKVYRIDGALTTLIYNPNYAGTDRWQSLAFAPDGLNIATGGNNGNVRIWDVPSQGSRYFDVGKSQEFAERQVVDIAYSYNGQYIGGVVNTVSGSYAILLDAQTHVELVRVNGGSYNGVNFFGSIAFHPHDDIVALGGADGSIRLWNIADLISQHEVDRDFLSRVLRAHSDSVVDVVFSSDGSKMASASWDRTVRVWNYQTGENTTTLKGHSDRVRAVAFNPQATLLASGGDDGTVKLWNLATQKDVTLSQIVKKSQYDRLRMGDLAFNRDGSILAASRINGDISLFDVTTHQQIITFNGGDSIWHIAFNQAGTLLASASAGDTSVRLWGVPQQ